MGTRRLQLLYSRYEKHIALALLALAFLGGAGTYLVLSNSLAAARDVPVWQNPATISGLLTLDGVVVLLLAGMMSLKIAGLWRGKIHHRGASKLQIRMAALFAGVATLPAILLIIFSTFFFQLGIQSWFSHQVSTAVHEAQAVASAYLDEHRKVIQADVMAAATDIDRQSTVLYADPDDLGQFLNTQSFLRNFGETVLFTRDGRVLGRGGVGLTFDPADVPLGTLQDARVGTPVVFTLAQDEEKIQAVIQLASAPDVFLYVNRAVDPTVLSYVSATRDASTQYQALENKRGDIQSRFFMIYLAVTLLILLASVWGGLYIASTLLVPIENLIGAAQQVREGNLNVRIPEKEGADEFDDLIHIFNNMTTELADQRSELIRANHRLDTRRRFTETVLAGVTSGVMAVDAGGIIRLVNEPAARILGLKLEHIMRAPLRHILPSLTFDEPAAGGGADTVQTREISYTRRDQQRRILLVRVAGDTGSTDQGGVILTFDDITLLQAAQRQSAWSDVARRIAHEIKNPLTPIQLSAERLRRRFTKDINEQDQPVFTQCVDTIIRHVGDIGRMAGEFASFARMPEPAMKSEDLGIFLKDVLNFHHVNSSGVEVRGGGLLAGTDVPTMPAEMDSAQMRQALNNLILNAIEATSMRLSHTPEPMGRVMVYLTRQDDRYALSIIDNGIGFPADIPLEHLCEPYVTFREKGTGLGLAIVKKIIEDHKGSMILNGPEGIRALAGMEGTGAVVTLFLPIPLDQSAEVMENRPHAA